MAYINYFTCSNCGEEKYEIITNSSICQQCQAKLAEIKRKSYMDVQKTKTLEKRIEEIELRLYDLNLESKLSVLGSLIDRKY